MHGDSLALATLASFKSKLC